VWLADVADLAHRRGAGRAGGKKGEGAPNRQPKLPQRNAPGISTNIFLGNQNGIR
jgi:hypothetical protein